MPAASYWPLPSVVTFDPAAQGAPDLGEDQFLESLQALLPQGKAWTRDPDSVLTGFLRGLARGFARVHQRALALLADSFPATTSELLPEWEASLGLPDPCIGQLELESDRRAQVVARLTNPGGQSVQYFIDFAAQLGYAITITEFSPSRFGHSFGMPFGGDDWAHAWEVSSPLFTVHYFQFGVDQFGDRFAVWGGTVLECELRRIAPAQSVLFFDYTPV